jgi:hypothetical protein
MSQQARKQVLYTHMSGLSLCLAFLSQEEEMMSQQKEIQVLVALEESHWRAIMNILLLECQRKGGDWLRWGESINFVIESAIQSAIDEARMSSAILHPEGSESKTSKEIGASRETAVDVGHDGPSCPKCGGPMYQVGTYEELPWHVYQCSRCGERHNVEMSRSEMIKRGDYSFLEDWEMGMVDDL